MPNTYFQFKEFVVHQEKCAMKVCTDACLFGAWIAANFKNTVIPDRQALDIGTGTGLLSLMLAQEFDIKIDAVEIEPNAYQQAKSNIGSSSWSDSIKLFHQDILQFEPGKQYGLILSNPPFFSKNLKGPDDLKNLAKHESALELSVLFSKITGWLAPGGFFALLIPADRSTQAIAIAETHQINLLYQTLVRQSTLHTAFRAMLIFGNGKAEPVLDEICIRDNGVYTAKFSSFLDPYYL